MMSHDTREQVLAEVIAAIRSASGMLGASGETVTPDTRLAEELGMDSLRLVSTLSALEDRYDIEFSVEDTDARRFHQVSDILNVTLRALESGEA
jgi:acyl carrier protein